MQKTFRILLVVFMLAAFAAVPVAAAPGPNSDAPNSGPSIDNSRALVQLKGDPLSTYAKTRPPQGKKIDFDQSTVKAYRAQLAAQRNEFKRWLRANAPKAKVTGEFDISLNALAVELNGEALEKVASAPMVAKAEYQGLYSPTQDSVVDPDLALISAMEAWAQQGGPAGAGEGIKVAIVDTGIDATHPCFDDAGYPAQDQLGDSSFTNNKVIAAKVFNMRTTSRKYTAEAINSHGTHVAGTVACNYNTPAVVDGVEIPYGISGVAPRALLGNYNVFPANEESARSEDILNALEAAYADGFDVANMSLSGGAAGIQDLLTIAVDNLDAASMVVAVAAGNSGPGHYTVGSPGSAVRALTAGASTVPHFIGTPVVIGTVTYPAVAGDFATVEADLTAPLGVVMEGAGLGLACTPIAQDLTGQIAVVSRGGCTFSTKIRNAEAKGALATLVVNNSAGDPTAMAQDGTPNQPVIPAYMVALADKQAFIDANGQTATILAGLGYFITGNADFMASFSSQGPTDVDFRVKPDVVAPGVNVLSSIPLSFCAGSPCFAFFQGTSMATPHLAGSAAVVKSQHPGWTAAQIRSAIVNTADQGVLKKSSSTALETDGNIIGAGRENLLSAVNASVALDPVSISFGALPSGSGQTLQASLTLTNLSGAPGDFGLAVSGGGDVSYSLSDDSLSLGAGESATVILSMTSVKGAAGGGYQGTLAVTSGGVEVAHAVVFTLIK